MSQSRSSTRRQRAVIEDLFTSEANEREVLARHDVTQSLYSRWLADERFAEALEERIAQAHHAGRIMLARAAPEAAKKLIELAKGKEGETTRKACLDIITTQTPTTSNSTASPPNETETVSPLSPEAASRLLAFLAEGNQHAGN
jgi:hypothetical protein